MNMTQEEREAVQRFYKLVEDVYVHRLEVGQDVDINDQDIFDALDDIKNKADADTQKKKKGSSSVKTATPSNGKSSSHTWTQSI